MELQPKYNDGSSQTRSEYNALVRNQRSVSLPQANGFRDGDTQVGPYNTDPIVRGWMPIISKIAIPAYSVFTLMYNPDTDNKTVPFGVQVERLGDAVGIGIGWRPALLTNGADELILDSSGKAVGSARVIDWFQPTILTNLTSPDEDTDPLPKPGYTCGPVGLPSFIIGQRGCGLLCLARSEDDKRSLCIAAPPAQRWLVKPVDTISSGTNGDVILWVGTPGAEHETDPQIKYKACNRTSGDLINTKFCEMVDIDGKLYVVPWECGATA